MNKYYISIPFIFLFASVLFGLPHPLGQTVIKDNWVLAHYTSFKEHDRATFLKTYCKFVKDVDIRFEYLEKRKFDLFSFENAWLKQDCKPTVLTMSFPYGPWLITDVGPKTTLEGVLYVEPVDSYKGAIQLRFKLYNTETGVAEEDYDALTADFKNNFFYPYLRPAYISLFRKIYEDFEHGPKVEVLNVPQVWLLNSWQRGEENSYFLRAKSSDFEYAVCTFDQEKHKGLPLCEETTIKNNKDDFLFKSLVFAALGGFAWAVKDRVYRYFYDAKSYFFPPKHDLRANLRKTRKSNTQQRVLPGEFFYIGNERDTHEREEASSCHEELANCKAQYRKTRTNDVEVTTDDKTEVKSTKDTKKAKSSRTLAESDILFSSEFLDEFLVLPQKVQDAIRDRIRAIGQDSHRGDAHSVGDSSFCGKKTKAIELRWKNGRRVYYVNAEGKLLFVRIGNKKSQESDIAHVLSGYDPEDIEAGMDKIQSEKDPVTH